MSTRIVTFANASFMPILDNWLACMARLGLAELATVVALDEATFAAMRARGVNALFRPPLSFRRGDFWLHRIDVIAEMLVAGDDIVHSDADAVWLRDPLARLTATSADLVFTQGTVFPSETLQRRGFVVCCGLMFIRSNAGAIEFWRNVRDVAVDVRDDQWAVNKVIDQSDCVWTLTDRYEAPCFDTVFHASRFIITGSMKDLAIEVLPHHEFPRLMELGENPFVAHPLADSPIDDKIDVLSESGLWFVDRPPRAVDRPDGGARSRAVARRVTIFSNWRAGRGKADAPR
ncbi:putative nucleotide-diphospho-sugar transferase [Methylocella silvestris]|uniref:Nucleotide-diphospho-sugar transferase domain-containing protein n=1 Tax=Methylocella silvestris TaxID=199596 RepID=A0A2J7TK26_METSI|nr:putative nucleotide-diphospho-sugar transferase [Methylocella silvestris]PNG27116.1 hypothetical protein CR492_05350 [Methylocella silvestris]